MLNMADDRTKKLRKQYAYAKSILQNAILIGGIDEALNARGDLYDILKASLSNENLSSIFRDNEYNEASKMREKIDVSKIVRNVFKGASQAVINVLDVMAHNQDMYLSLSMYETYNKLLEEHFNVIVVDVVTRVSLDDNLREIIKNKAKHELGAEIVLHEHHSDKILGGIVMTAKNRILDCSLLTILERSKQELVSVHHYE